MLSDCSNYVLGFIPTITMCFYMLVIRPNMFVSLMLLLFMFCFDGSCVCTGVVICLIKKCVMKQCFGFQLFSHDNYWYSMVMNTFCDHKHCYLHDDVLWSWRSLWFQIIMVILHDHGIILTMITIWQHHDDFIWSWPSFS